MWNNLIGWAVILGTLPLIYLFGIPSAWILDGRKFRNTSIGMRLLAGVGGISVLILVGIAGYGVNSAAEAIGRTLTGNRF